jgi:hypothetical protein
VITNPDGEQLPIIETDVQAPDEASATKLANATITGLTDYLDKRAAADQDVDERRRLRVSGLGSAQATVAARGPGRAVAVAAAIVIFLAGCASILLVSALARSWRAAEVSEQAETIDLAPDDTPSEDFAFDDLSLDLEPVRLAPRRSERDDEARAESA